MKLYLEWKSKKFIKKNKNNFLILCKIYFNNKMMFKNYVVFKWMIMIVFIINTFNNYYLIIKRINNEIY